MNELRDLYQEVILDHRKKPRNFRPMENADFQADGHNPLCGDRVTIFLKVHDGVIEDVSFQGEGCAISMASASLMTEVLKGKTSQEAEELFGRFHDLVTDNGTQGGEGVSLGKLEVLAGVREFPMRVKCATLAWHTLHAALEHKNQAVTTE
ncbi:SUF system FeS assembly protein, NifU family [Nitrosococcus halophilus Nc 4]|uniref:SUF system FeS assembly protein, NifU family n=1 Tax=Nitrosococcus halophilus (strain Nc4) TaxID=472759 RepID=D5BWZ1_NITHN|nr:SUF system NifU family Fe-S cluster assembly protein [Nitrosococcus halophilus]ADE13872.1 SUF system FeS assembly protein, NifU family [Nitrosococcus halophilus Nc 4]